MNTNITDGGVKSLADGLAKLTGLTSLNLNLLK